MSTRDTCQHCDRPLDRKAVEGLCPECLMKVGLGSGTMPRPEDGPPAKSRFIPPPPDELQVDFPQIDILQLIGQGGMGAVYKARQKSLDRIVALKILPPETGRDAAFSQRFAREAQALARLNHPNIVGVYDFGEAGGFFYFTMEFVAGLNLRDTLTSGELSPREALAIVPQICDALQYAHDRGIVHRDIKPENILLDRTGRVKIADFGLAKMLGVVPLSEQLTEAKDVVGTPHYMAPEQVERPTEVDHRADIYSLGVVFYELLTGELPLGRFSPPSRKVQIDVRLDDVVLRALEKAPERRYRHASDLKTDVETVLFSPDPDAAPEAPRTPADSADPAATPPQPGRQAALWYGFVVSLFGLPIGIALQLPYVWGLSLAGIVISAAKLNLTQWLAVQWGSARQHITGSSDEAPPADPDDTHGTRPEVCQTDPIPRCMWLALGTMTLCAACKLVAFPQYGPWVIADLSLILGLRFRLRVAYVATLFFAVFGFAWAALNQSSLVTVAVLLLNTLVAVPVWLSTHWYFPGAPPDGRRQRALALAATLFLLPPTLFIGFVRTGWGIVDYDIDVQFFVALAGLPMSVLFGAVLAWALKMSSPALQFDATPESAADRRWSWRAIVAATLLMLALPPVAGSVVMGQAIAADPSWNPSSEEAIVSLMIFGGASLLALASAVLGLVASRDISAAGGALRGRWAAWAAVWIWPALLAGGMLLKVA